METSLYAKSLPILSILKFSIIIALVCVTTMFSCKKDDFGKIDNLNGGKIDVFGHSGMGETNAFQPLPINSWASLNQALNNTGADGVELDVQITLDSVLVSFHEQDLNYSTNCTGCIPHMDHADLENCAYVANFPGQEHGLVNIKDLISKYDISNPPYFSLDNKTALQCVGSDEILEYLNRLAVTYQKLVAFTGRQDHVWIETQAHELALGIKALDPSIRVYWESNEMPEGIDQAVQLGCDGLVVSNDVITAEMVRTAHDLGLFVSIWHMSDRNSHIKAINKHPDHIQTDNISVALDLLR